MSPDQNGVPYWGRELSRRVERLEALEPAVVANEVKNLAAEVRSMRRSAYMVSISAVSSSLIFAFSVFALLGGH